MAISIDFTPTLAHWRKELNVSYPVLSDNMRTVSEQYGILIKNVGVSNRATFVVDKDGKMARIGRLECGDRSDGRSYGV